jgi:hypothetical protein
MFMPSCRDARRVYVNRRDNVILALTRSDMIAIYKDTTDFDHELETCVLCWQVLCSAIHERAV